MKNYIRVLDNGVKNIIPLTEIESVNVICDEECSLYVVYIHYNYSSLPYRLEFDSMKDLTLIIDSVKENNKAEIEYLK